MKNKKINSLVIVLSVTLIFGIASIILVRFLEDNNKRPAQEIDQKNIKENNQLKQGVGKLDSSWQNYINNELGISFQYPIIWGDVELKYVDETMSLEEINGPKVYKGNGVYISFTKNSADILLASPDFNQFLIDSYNGGKDLSLGCVSLSENYKKDYCKDIVVAGQKTYGYYQHLNMECSGDSLWYHLPLNLPKGIANYTGLQVNYSIDFPISETDFSDPCGRTPENIKVNLESISKRENLSDKIFQSLTDYDKFLASLKFVE